ncbi:hypothetical protein WJX74_010951 [Apatococcus lobatus]|uniref:DJ-1/PfpI domain-containing protein n=2 Tax=Apatococcus TaxID=904362 RepID=A0AAW1SJD9_9CHLO
MAIGKVLILATSVNKVKDTASGCWVEEVAAPYYAFKTRGIQVDVASVQGGEIPWDPNSMKGDFFTPTAQAFSNDAEAKEKCTKSAALSSISSIDGYDGLFIPGGHGIVFDGPGNKAVADLIAKFWQAGKVVSAVCHGPVALAGVQIGGKPLVSGKKVTGFSNAEEKDVGKVDEMPFLLEDRLKEDGGIYQAMPNWHSHTVTDGKLITGQNPQSSERVGNAVADAIIGTIDNPITIGSNAHKRAAGGGNEYLSGVADGVTVEDPQHLAATAPNKDFKAHEKSVTQT